MRQLLQRDATPRGARPLLTALAAVGVGLAPAFVAPPVAGAAPTCTTTGATATCTFAYTGAAETWTVPAGVTSATFALLGAQGGDLSGDFPGSSPGGLGGAATATLAVTPGQTLQINVGGVGGHPVRFGPLPIPGGFNGGGVAYYGGSCTGSGGGGATDVRWDDPSKPGAFTLDERLLVAGGGGAGSPLSGAPGGGGGGVSGGDGSPSPTSGTPPVPGRGGTQTAGGAGGGHEALDGSLGVGGSTGNSCGGAGGGGYYGGGGGFASGGGGGSGFGPAGTVFQTGVRAGVGQVTVTYSLGYTFSGFLAPVDNAPTLNTGKAGRTYAVKWRLTDAAGAPVSAPSAVASVAVQGTDCNTLGTTTAPLEAEAAGDSVLRYDAAAGQYVYTWKTPGAAGCYTLVLTLDSGQTQRAFFQLS
jgi:hypothetical protein